MMIELRFYAELNDLLPDVRRYTNFAHSMTHAAPVEEVIESLGVPLAAVDLILANGESVDSSYTVRDGDRISVYPVFEALNISALTRLLGRPLRRTRFVLGTDLGGLAERLRRAGFDAICQSSEDLARISREERRILLTRDASLLRRGEITHGYCVRATAADQQFAEVMLRFDLISWLGMAKVSIRDLALEGKRVFMRVDFNVPLAAGGQEITSDKRIKASLPSIQYALEHGAGVILASHLGRPKGKPNPEMSLKPVAKRLAQLLGREVKMAPDSIGPEVEAMKPAPGEVVLLENLRFHAEEEKNDPEFSRKLAALCDVYVNDAFGSAHRAHASTVGMIAYVHEAAAGLLMEQELKYLTMATRNPPRPCVAILGGAKVSDKIEVIANLGRVVDKLLIGGAMAYTFLKAQGEPVGRSLVEDDKLDLAKRLIADLKDKLILPVDHVVVSEIKEGAASEIVDNIPDGKIGVDIGPLTIDHYAHVIRTAKTVIWNGPMGVFEKKPFDRGTVALAKAVAASGATSIVGGGDSEKAIKSAGVADQISHISTGGGASLEFLAGIELPGVAALPEK